MSSRGINRMNKLHYFYYPFEEAVGDVDVGGRSGENFILLLNRNLIGNLICYHNVHHQYNSFSVRIDSNVCGKEGTLK